MAGKYCRFCDHRCFVNRELPDGSWSGHMATCPEGAAHDRKVTGYDFKTAVNPSARKKTAEPGACRWCGRPRDGHYQRWIEPVGWHTFTEPTDEQRKTRMLAKRD